jgi:glyoxylase-like metal-dependent hydrolase (beta-lactamase superfamily II)
MNDEWVSNTYLVGDETGGSAVLIDAGGPVAPLLEAIEREQLTLTHVLLTHHHHDHVAELDAVLEAHPGVPVLAHPAERELVMGVTGDVNPGDTVRSGALSFSALHTPGHTAGMLAFVVDGNVFTGDTLFKGSVGGVRAPGHTSYADLKRSIMETLMALPPETLVHPGHTDPSTIGDEFESNAFIRVWRGLDDEGDEQCKALG